MRFADVPRNLAALCGAALLCAVAPGAQADTPPANSETSQPLEQALKQMSEKLRSVKTLSCTLEMSKKHEKKKDKRKVKSGPMQIARGKGGRISLTRKGQTEEYIANAQVIWAYDHKDKEALHISTGFPVIGPFVDQALRLNVFMALDEDTLKLVGEEPLNDEACWVFQGKSPRKLKLAGVPVSKVRVWIAKSDGLPRKIHLPDEKDLTIVLRDINVNLPMESETFNWSPPEGVKKKNIFGL